MERKIRKTGGRAGTKKDSHSPIPGRFLVPLSLVLILTFSFQNCGRPLDGFDSSNLTSLATNLNSHDSEPDLGDPEGHEAAISCDIGYTLVGSVCEIAPSISEKLAPIKNAEMVKNLVRYFTSTFPDAFKIDVSADGPDNPLLSALDSKFTSWSQFADFEVATGTTGEVFNVLDYGADPTGEAASDMAFEKALADLRDRNSKTTCSPAPCSHTLVIPRGEYSFNCPTGICLNFSLVRDTRILGFNSKLISKNPQANFLLLLNSKNLTFHNLILTYRPLPYIQGKILSLTQVDNEQALIRFQVQDRKSVV